MQTNEIIVYLDADIVTYPENIVELLSGPITDDEADFVKSCFDRQAGRVTELVAKPLLSLLFPEMTRFSQPLSGMIGARKSLLKKIDFENDYGVDIGILLDMHTYGGKNNRGEYRVYRKQDADMGTAGENVEGSFKVNNKTGKEH